MRRAASALQQEWAGRNHGGPCPRTVPAVTRAPEQPRPVRRADARVLRRAAKAVHSEPTADTRATHPEPRLPTARKQPPARLDPRQSSLQDTPRQSETSAYESCRTGVKAPF